MRTLGVVLAGGKSSRFGSDKAIALLNGRPLIEHVLGTLAGQTDEVAVAGRHYAEVLAVGDRPEPGLGPLGGLCGALVHAAGHGFDCVLSCSVDCPELPVGLFQRAPSYLAAQPVIGLWPAAAADALLHFLATDPRRSVRGFAEVIGAVAVQSDFVPANLNTPGDLAALRSRAK